jgi:putative tricarboxylic transport membrane protein
VDMLISVLSGFEVALLPTNLLYCFVGVLLGTLVGVLPGVGPTATIAMLLPITFTLPPDTAVIMLAGIYYGTQYGGSTTAILMNLPGEASAIVTAIDGHEMAKKGRAGSALAIAAIGSFIAGTFATCVIVVAAVPLTAMALKFGPVEYFSLIVLGLVCTVALASGSLVRATAMIVLGMIFGIVGMDVGTGAFRFTYGFIELSDGIEIVSIAVGMFGLTEILRNFEETTQRALVTSNVRNLMPKLKDLAASAGAIARGAGIGTFLGVLPGGGALLSSFASYAIEKRVSRHPEEFGHGAIQGVAGPESANNAAAQVSFIPMLALGIPSNAVMALIIGALLTQGIVPGPNIINNQPALFWGLIASMWVGNLMLLIINLPLVGLWVRLLTIPTYVLFPAIIIFSIVGVYTISLSPFDLYTIAFFGVLGYVFHKLSFEPAPFIIGLILSPMLEENLRRAMVMARGDVAVFVSSPISLTCLVLAMILLGIVSLPSIRQKREMIFEEDT